MRGLGGGVLHREGEGWIKSRGVWTKNRGVWTKSRGVWTKSRGVWTKTLVLGRSARRTRTTDSVQLRKDLLYSGAVCGWGPRGAEELVLGVGVGGRAGGDLRGWGTWGGRGGTWGDVCSLCANIRKDVFFFGKPNALRERRWTKMRVGVDKD